MINLGVLQAVLQLKDSMSPQLLKASANLESTGRKITQAGRALLPLSVAIAGIGLASLKFAADFDSAMTKSIAIMGDLGTSNKAEFGAMRDNMETTAREVAKTTTFSAKQAAESYFFLASAGLDAATSIEVLPQVAQFAQAGMFDMARATDLLTDAQSALGLTIRDTKTGALDTIATLENMARVSDVLVKANTLANASVEQFSIALTTKAGAALKILGKDIEEGVAVLAAFADQGVKAADAGTGLSIILRDLSTKAINNKDEFAALGVSVFDAQGEMNNIGEIVSSLEGALAGMSDETAKATLLQLGFTDKSVSFIQTLIGMGDQIQRYEGELRSAGGATKEVADTQLTSFTAQLGLAKDRIVDVGIELGTVLIPIVLGLIDTLDPAIELLTDAVKWFGELGLATQLAAVGIAAAVAAIGPALIVIGAVVSGVGALLPLIAAAKIAFIAVGTSIAAAAAPLSALLLPALAVLAVAVAAVGIGLAIDKFLQWVGVIETAAEKTRRLVDALEPSASQTRAMAEASEIAGREITTWAEATKIMAEHNKTLRVESAALVPVIDDTAAAAAAVAPALESSAAARVLDAIATAKQDAEIAKLAASVSMSTEEFLKMDAAFQAATGALIVAEQQRAAATAVAGLNFGMETVISTMVDWEGKLVTASNAASLWSDITSEAFANTGVNAEAFGVATTGVGDLVVAKTAAMTAAFASFGLQTQSQLDATAAQAVKDFAIIEASGQKTAKELKKIWADYEDSRVTNTATTTEFTLSSGAELAAGAAGQLAQLGGKYKAFALAQAIIATALSVARALAGPPPFPFSIPQGIAAGIAGAVQIAAIASSGFEQGTPGLDFQNFRQESLVPVHGREAIIPQGGGHELAREIAAALGPGGGGGDGRTDSGMLQLAEYIGGGELAKDLARAVRDQVAQAGHR